MFFLIYLAY